jgi:hypothetical protein
VVVADAREQRIYSTAWADAMRSVDATGTSLLLDVQDWDRQQILWSDRSQLFHWVEFARAQRLANFSEDRYQWLNSVLRDQFRVVGSEHCEGKMETFDTLSNTSWRVNGWAWDRDAADAPQDIVLVDSSNRIAGLARGGVRHHDTGGYSPQVIISRAGWLGYYRGDQVPKKALVVLKDSRSVCVLPPPI